MILLEHKNVKIFIYELNTFVFNVKIMVILLFISGYFAVFEIQALLFMFLALIIILLLISGLNGARLFQYSPFKDVVIELDMNKNFSGHTIFHEKSKVSKKIPFDRKKYEPVNLESVDFMEKYNVYSTDQVEARYLLTTSMIERLNNLKLAFSANFIRGSFKDNKLILAIDTGKDMFAMGSDFKESNAQTFIDFFNEITSVMKIVDQLKLDEKTGL